MSIVQPVPMWRLTERIVRSGLVIAWRLATSPTRTSPVLENATTEGVVRPPSALGMTTGSPASSTETTEFVVPRSIPTAFGIRLAPVPFEQPGRAADLGLPDGPGRSPQAQYRHRRTSPEPSCTEQHQT